MAFLLCFMLTSLEDVASVSFLSVCTLIVLSHSSFVTTTSLPFLQNKSKLFEFAWKN